MPTIQPAYYPWLAGGAVVFIVLFAVLARKTLQNPALRREPAPIPEQRAARPVQFGSSAPKMADAVRTALSKVEIFALLKLVAAMAAYGPITDSAKHSENFQKVRITANSFMKPGVYNMFVSAFRRAASIDEDNPKDVRPLDQITGYPLDDLADRNDVLAIMVAYIPSIIEFYRKNADNPRFVQEFLGDDAMNSAFGKLNRIHREFYTH